MKMSKKARSMAAVLAVMALTTGVSGVQASPVAVDGNFLEGYTVDSDKMGTALGIDGMKESINSIAADVANQGVEIGELQKADTDLQSQIDTNRSSITSVGADVANQGVEIGELQKADTDLQSQIDTNRNSITSVAKDVAYQGVQIGDLQKADEGLQNQITENKTNIDGLSAEVEKQGYKVDTALKVEGNGVLYNHGTDLTTGINLNTSAIDQEIKDREATDGELQSQIDTNRNSINSVAADVAFQGVEIKDLQEADEGLQSQITENKTNIDGLSAEVEKQGYKVDTALKVEGNGVLYNHGTDLTTGINLNTSAIDQEIKDRETADDELQSQIDTNKTNIGNLDDQINGKDGIVDELSDVEAKADGALKVQGNGVLYNHGTDLTTGINLNTSAIEQEVKDRETADQQLQQGINTNTAAINSVKTTVGSGVLTSGAADLTTGINQNYAQIQQNYAQIQQNTNAINSLDSRIDDLGGEIDQVGAVSAALAGLHPLDYDGTGSKFQLSAAMGSYDSSQAAAIGAFYHFNRDVMISLGGATSFDGDHKTAGNLGVTFRIGEGASGKAVSDDVMARLEAMDQKIAALEQENKDLKNVLGAIDTSLSKEFPDVPANHWAYEAVTKLAGNDVVAGYPDGEFHGDRTMTRYEMAEVIYKAMQKGAKVDQKLVNEFKPEMEQVAANQNA